jgi:putative flippase GtrA
MRRVIYFLIVGALVCGVDFGTLSVLKRLLPTMAAVSIAYAAGVSTHFCLNKWWVFESRTPVNFREVTRYLLMVLVCWLCTVAVVWAMLHLFTNNVYIARTAAIPPATIAGFLLLKSFVFPMTR